LKVFGRDHPVVAGSYSILAENQQAQHKYAEAERLFKQALAILRTALGPEHARVGHLLMRMGDLYLQTGRNEETAPLLTDALTIANKASGPDRQEAADALFMLGQLEWSRQRPDAAEAHFEQNLTIYSKIFAEQFAYMTENDRLAFLDKVAGLFPTFLSFGSNYGVQRPSFAAKMYDAVLWQKGMVASSVTAQRAAVLASQDSQTLALLDQLTGKKNQLAALLRALPVDQEQWRKALDRLQRESDDLEQEVTKRSNAFAEQKPLVHPNWQQVSAALKAHEGAVEFIRFPVRDRAVWTKKTHYAALVLTRTGPGTGTTLDAPVLVPLGDAEQLEGAPMDDYRQRVARGPAPANDAGVRFYRAFWKPLEPALNGVSRVYVSPDGLLNQVSWAAVAGDDGHLLIEKYDIDVVLSTKDLLRREHSLMGRHAVLIGNPAFDLSEPEQRAALVAVRGKADTQALIAGLTKPGFFTRQDQLSAVDSAQPQIALGQRSRDEQNGALDPLPGTQKEIESAERLLKKQEWQVETYTQQSALKEVIMSVRNPKLLHIATHGFFEADQASEPAGWDQPSGKEDPMLRSGLYFAGANRTLAGSAPVDLDNGVMTAFEATGLNLQGTELVVLSACETGLGRIQNGEGIFGLRRAMQEAGAEAVLMSMWSVPDRETEELMSSFYEKWLSGKGKHEALHQAQLELRKETIAKWGDDRPYYWAAFVLVGR
jgi:CHAT domain-containing protein/tetratricopeptide (TPR) repeat protein